MASKYKGKFKKGMRIWRRNLSENSAPVDTQRLYEITSIGLKQAIITQIDPLTGKNIGWRGKGCIYYLFPGGEWSQIFVCAGEKGWNGECNT